MTTDATLAALTAGLARDEAIAQAAAEADTAETGDGSWFAAEADHHGIGLCESKSQAARIGYYPTVDTEHITRHPPARALRQVEAIRRVVAAINEADNGSGPEPDPWALCAEIAEALAGIYTEPTEEPSNG